MMFEYAEPTSLAEMQERHKEIRRRLYAKPQKRAPAPKPRPKEVCSIVFLSQHDAHVVDYRTHMRAKDAGETFERLKPVAEIIKEVAEKHGVTPAQILGPRRSYPIVAARHEAMAQAYLERPDLSIVQIGRQFKRDHTTLLSAAKKMGVWNSADSRTTD